MDISYLKEFRVLAEICNYQEAAEQLYISLSALSKHISRLEAELGATLFDRTTRNVTLNKYGAVFYEYAVLITDSYQNCTLKLEELQQDEAACLRIAFPPCLTEYNLPSLLTDFISTHPDIKVIISEHESPHDLLRENRCDIAFCTEYGDPDGRESTLFAESDGSEKGKTTGFANHGKAADGNSAFFLQLDSLVAVLPANHPLAGEKSLAMKQLKEERFIIKSDPSSELSIIFHRLCDAAGFKPKTTCAIRYTSAMPKMVNAYNSIAVTNRRHAMISDAPELAVIDISPAIPYCVAVLSSGNPEHAAARLCFMEYLSDIQPTLLPNYGER